MQKYSNDKQNVPRRAEMAVGGLRVNRQVSKTGIIQKTKAADVMYADESQPEIRQQRQQSHARQKNMNQGQGFGMPRRNQSSVGARNNR